MALSKKPYRGCRDFFPQDMRVRNYLFDRMKTTAERFGFEPYDGPLLEEVELYKAKSGEELIGEQIYSFTDRGDRFVAIRPEMTPTLARMVASVHKETTKPIRWYSIPNLMRYEKPQRGRVREHWQFNVDIFGAPENLAELEVFSLITQFLASFGATSEMFSILVNDRKVVDAVFNKLLNLNQDQSYKLYKVIDKAKKVDEAKLDQMIKDIITDTEQFNIFKKYLSLTNFQDLKSFLDDNNLAKDCDSLLTLTEKITSLSLDEYIVYDPTIVRGLDYYTGVVFEIFDKHPDNSRAIAGGGAYGNLLSIFNEEPLGGIGFGLGDVTLRDFLETHQLLPDLSNADLDLLVVNTDEKHNLENIILSNALRKNQLRVESHLGKIKFNKIFKLAESKGHNVVAIIEERDEKLSVQLKNLKNRNIEFFEPNETEKIYKYIEDAK